jgi:CBS domain containing-hemolysin-like protein
VLLTSLGLAAALGRLHPLVLAALMVLVVIPSAIIATYALPRALARRWPQQVVRGLVPWVDRLGRILAPLLPSNYGASEHDVTGLLRAGTDAELFEQDELAVLSGLLAFTERPVREIMTARTDIVAVPEGEAAAAVVRIVAESGYSRLPVYVRPVVVAPASKRCADLLFEMQHQRRRFAVLLDEFGGTAGIATMDDLLSALVGAVFGEPAGARGAVGATPGLLEADGASPAADVAARFDVRLPAGPETVSGLLTRLAGRIPHAGERFVLQGLEWDVLAASPTRVDRVVVRRTPVTVTSLPRGEAP